MHTAFELISLLRRTEQGAFSALLSGERGAGGAPDPDADDPLEAHLGDVDVECGVAPLQRAREARWCGVAVLAVLAVARIEVERGGREREGR